MHSWGKKYHNVKYKICGTDARNQVLKVYLYYSVLLFILDDVKH